MEKQEKQLDLEAVQAQIDKMLEMAQKKADEIIEAAEKKAGEIKQTNIPQEPVQRKEEPRVQIKLRRDNDKLKDDLPVSVNGKQYLIQRGIMVNVPLSVAEAIENSELQDEIAVSYAAGLQEDYDNRVSKL